MNIDDIKNELHTIAERLTKISSYIESSDNSSINVVKRQYGNGSITLRKDGRYQGGYYVHGKQYYVYSKNYDECRHLLDLALKDYESVGVQTLSTWLNSWYKTFKEPFIKTNTQEIYNCCINKYILPMLGTQDVKRLDSEKIQEALNSIEFSRQKEICFNILNSAYMKAVELKKVKLNPLQFLTKPKSQTKQGKAFTIEQQQKFIDVLQVHKMQNIFLCYLYTGARRNELLSLKWSDIDYIKKVVLICGTKTSKSIRYVPLTQKLYDIFKSIEHVGEYVFNFKSDYINRQFQDICKQADLQGFTVHSLRHTFATRCLEKGVNEKVLQGWLGHSNISMTLNTYSHIQKEFELKEALKLNNL